MQERRGPSPFGGRLALLGLAGLLLALAGLSVALVASAQQLPLTVTKSAAPTAVEPGGNIAYTLTITNTGDEDISLQAITDTLPAGFSYAGWQEGDEPSSESPLVWRDLEDLYKSSSFRLVYYVAVEGTVQPGVYSNTVTVLPEDGDPVSASVDVTVLGAILEGSKTASASEVKVGDPLDYTVRIDNNGTSTATLTTIVDTLPADFDFQSMLAGPDPQVQDDVLTWSNLEVGPGQSLELRYRVTTGGAVNAAHTNQVQVTSPDDDLPPMSASVTLRERKFRAYLPLIIRTEPPAPPETPYRVAFQRQDPGNLEVYAVNSDGTGLLNVSNMAGGDTTPQFSPDGTRIAWVHFQDGVGEIMVANADGSGRVNVTNHAKDDRGPVWSPDGTKIAFYSLRQEERWEVYSMNPDGSNVQRLTDRSCQSHDPAWSPDGTKIGFICGLREFAEVYVMNADGSNWQRLTEDPTDKGYFEDAALTWSADSQWLGYVKYRDKGHSKGGGVYRVNVNTKEIVTIMESDSNAFHAPAWSPDGTKLAFSAYRPIDSGSYDIVVVNPYNPDGSTNLTMTAKFDNQPRWSSDGAKITFISNRASSDASVFHVYVMDANGSNQVRVTAGTVDERNPAWRPQPPE